MWDTIRTPFFSCSCSALLWFFVFQHVEATSYAAIEKSFPITVGEYAAFLNEGSSVQEEQANVSSGQSYEEHRTGASSLFRSGSPGSYRYHFTGSSKATLLFLNAREASAFCSWKNRQGFTMYSMPQEAFKIDLLLKTNVLPLYLIKNPGEARQASFNGVAEGSTIAEELEGLALIFLGWESLSLVDRHTRQPEESESSPASTRTFHDDSEEDSVPSKIKKQVRFEASDLVQVSSEDQVAFQHAPQRVPSQGSKRVGEKEGGVIVAAASEGLAIEKEWRKWEQEAFLRWQRSQHKLDELVSGKVASGVDKKDALTAIFKTSYPDIKGCLVKMVPLMKTHAELRTPRKVRFLAQVARNLLTTVSRMFLLQEFPAEVRPPTHDDMIKIFPKAWASYEKFNQLIDFLRLSDNQIVEVKKREATLKFEAALQLVKTCKESLPTIEEQEVSLIADEARKQAIKEVLAYIETVEEDAEELLGMLLLLKPKNVNESKNFYAI